jgi:hypothetical protein
MRPLVARCHLGLGALQRRSGHGDDAKAHLTRAMSMFVGMEMPFWSHKANVEMRTLVDNSAVQ